MRLGLQHSYAALPSRFYARVAPTAVPDPKLVVFNTGLARDLGLDPEALEPEAAVMFSGNRLPEDADPIAMAYAGHQFGGFVPSLGDGRAILFGELSRSRPGLSATFSSRARVSPLLAQRRRACGAGPMLPQEVLISEAMHALGIPTTRSLAVVTRASGCPNSAFYRCILTLWPPIRHFALRLFSTSPRAAITTP